MNYKKIYWIVIAIQRAHAVERTVPDFDLKVLPFIVFIVSSCYVNCYSFHLDFIRLQTCFLSSKINQGATFSVILDLFESHLWFQSACWG